MKQVLHRVRPESLIPLLLLKIQIIKYISILWFRFLTSLQLELTSSNSRLYRQTLLGLIISLSLSVTLTAQNIQLHYESHLLSNNEKLSLVGDTSLSDMVFEIAVTNNTSTTMDISCQRYELDSITDSDLYMCWQNCTVLDFGGTISLSPGETTHVFGAHCNPNGHFGVERNLYTFYNANNPNDSSSFQAVFSTSSFLIENENDEALILEHQEFWGVPNENLTHQIAGIKNISENELNIRVQQNIIALASGADINFEWGNIVYNEQDISAAVGIMPQESNSSFYTHFYGGGELGISQVQYVFFEENNTENLQQIDFTFNTTSVGIFSTEIITYRAYPNPALNQIKISYQLYQDLENIDLEVYNLSGQMVYQKGIRDVTGSVLIPLRAGSYFYRFSSNSKSTSLSKFVIVSE